MTLPPRTEIVTFGFLALRLGTPYLMRYGWSSRQATALLLGLFITILFLVSVVI